MRLSLIPREARFFDLFEQAGANLVEMARALEQLLTDYTDVGAKLQHLQELEHAGDSLVGETMRSLNRTFITPLDREDITALIHSIDDVVDKAWAAATRLQIYQIDAPTDTARQLARILVQMAELIVQVLPTLRHRGEMQRILPVREQIDRLETEADEALRRGLGELFANPTDLNAVVRAVKWREIYDFLEEATDSAEDVGDELESILLKHG